MILQDHGLPSPLYVLTLLTLATRALAQDATPTTNQPTSTIIQSTTTPNPTQNQGNFPFQSSMVPSDSAPAGNHNNNQNSGGLVNYYFVFLALIVAVAGAVVFIIIRKRRRLVLRRRYSQNIALSRDLGGPRPGGGWSDWNPERTGRYWHGRWMSADTGRDEGLNEQGEAPPPYVPKRRSQEAERREDEPAVPLQTLSRDGAGLKPPDYSEDYTQELGRSSEASAGSSREQERRQNG